MVWRLPCQNQAQLCQNERFGQHMEANGVQICCLLSEGYAMPECADVVKFAARYALC